VSEVTSRATQWASNENPLLRSGLAFAGANLRNGKDDDGILTALEATGLNLWGTKLVVLSACDTGVGEVRTGEGVYGLRRAFTLAGAEALVMSLWPISDFTTRTLMTSYYQNLKQGMGRGEALRQVQLAMLKKNPNLHPFYWANFIQSGDWGNLEGGR
jgi:CHAT domain-containing protein